MQTIRDLCGKGFNVRNGGDEVPSKDDGDASKGRSVAEAEGGKQRVGRRGSFMVSISVRNTEKFLNALC
jgi:hypothetical protein